MTDLDTYLARHFLNEAQLATASALELGRIDELIQQRLIPAPSYVVTDAGTVRSFVFGLMPAPGAVPGRYFPRAQPLWVARAQAVIADPGVPDPQARMKEQFAVKFGAALATLNMATWRLRDCFGDDGAPLADGLRARIDTAWDYLLNGTYGLCVANPISEAQIAYKEVLQEKLVQLSENGGKTVYGALQLVAMHELIDAYAAAAMPFSPVEYAVSSRKRLVDDLRANLRASNADGQVLS